MNNEPIFIPPINADEYVSNKEIQDKIQNGIQFIDKMLPINISIIILFFVLLAILLLFKRKNKKINKILIICQIICLICMIISLLGTILIVKEIISY